jgi:hypothetical protein
MFFKYISFKVFFLSLALGLLFVYLSQPTPTIIYVYPTPDNAGQITYKDQANNCFQFEATEVKCPANRSKVKKIPVQTGEKKGDD